MRAIIYPYKMGSQSARTLARTLPANLRAKRVRENGNYHLYRNHLIINWGNPRLPQWMRFHPQQVLNWPDEVAAATNKLQAYRVMEGTVNIPEFTTEDSVVDGWLMDGHTILSREILNGHGGIGIEVVTPEEAISNDGMLISVPIAPLYVKYVKKRDEYRIHVFNGNIIDVQKKRRMSDKSPDEVNYKIRNHQNGWVFCRNNLNPPACVLEQAQLAVNALNLDFGAVDIGYNYHTEEATVYEVNTAPGLEGTTIQSYVRAIQTVIRGR